MTTVFLSKASRQFSQEQIETYTTGACLFMGISRVTSAIGRNDARVSQDQNVLDFVLEKRRRQPKLKAASFTAHRSRHRWQGAIVCSLSCVKRASGSQAGIQDNA
jgi:hypothetical protein